jgi:hypothetical protein
MASDIKGEFLSLINLIVVKTDYVLVSEGAINNIFDFKIRLDISNTHKPQLLELENRIEDRNSNMLLVKHNYKNKSDKKEQQL